MIIKLRRFNKYLAEIQRLKAANTKLQSDIDYCREEIAESYDRAEERASRAERRIRAAESERIERERQEESDRWYREDQLRSATKDIERAVSYGDDYGIKRATEKLKKLD